MGWCAELGPEIQAGCRYSMIAHHDNCSCEHCGAVCRGLFAACKTVWAAGPRPVVLRAQADGASVQRGRAAAEADEGRLVKQSTPRPGGANRTMPQISDVLAVSPAIGRPSAPARPEVGLESVEGVPSSHPDDLVRQLQTALAEVAAFIHVRRDEFEDRLDELQGATGTLNRLEVQLTDVQERLAALKEQNSYLERVLGGLRGDVASLLVLQRRESHGC